MFSKLIIATIFALSTLIGKDIKNKNLVSAKNILDTKFQKWAEKSINSNIDYTITSIKSYLVFSFIILMLLFSVASIAFKNSLFTQTLSLEISVILLISMFGFKTTVELKRISKSYADWMYKHSIVLVVLLGITLYIFYNAFIFKQTSSIDILQDKKLLQSFCETSIVCFFTITLVVYFIAILLPFLITYLISLYVRFILKRSIQLEGNTFNHFSRYYGYTFLLVSFIILLAYLFFEAK